MNILSLVYTGIGLLFIVVLIVIGFIREITLKTEYEVTKLIDVEQKDLLCPRISRYLVKVKEKKAGIFKNRWISYEKMFYRASDKDEFIDNLNK